MPGRSAGNVTKAAKTGDRWSLAVSSLLILGLIIATTAMVQNRRIAPPDTKPTQQMPKPETATSVRPVQVPAIRLPPPPPARHAAAPSTAMPPPPELSISPRTITPLREATKAKRPHPKPQPVKPLKVTPIERTPFAEPRAKPAPESAPQQPIINAAQRRKTGGALLRLLEHGKGPAVEIAWPVEAADRRQLFRTLTQCYGMRLAVLMGKSRLYNETSEPGNSWTIDRDRYSGFIRSPQGEPVAEEEHRFAAIARRHGLTAWRPVRVFPRAVDAALLGGLSALLGARYRSTRQIRALYELRRAGLHLTGFQVDGRNIAGAISLPAVPRYGCD